MNNSFKFLLINKVIFLVALLMFCFSNFSNSQSVKAIHSSGALVPGQNITISVIFDDASNTYSFDTWDMYLNWNTDVLEWVSSTTVKSGLSGLNWTPPTYVNLPTHKVYFGFGSTLTYSNETIVNLTLKYHGGSTAISFYSDVNATNGCYIYDFTNIGDLILPNNFYTGCSIIGSLVPITSTGTGDWTDGTKWDLGHKPNTSNGNVIISNGNTITMNENANISGNLTINSGAALTVESGKALTISGDLLIKSDASGTGSFINNGTYTGTATIERYLTPWTSPVTADGWHLISSPVASQSIGPNFAAAADASVDFFSLDETTDNWIDLKPNANSTNFEVGKGYLVAYSPTSTLSRTFNGTINSGNFPLNLNHSGISEFSGYNLIGNPYSSGLSLSNIATWTKTNVDNYVMVWDNASSNYLTWDGTLNEVIPAMQGFLVKATIAGSASITIPSSERVHSAANVYKSTPTDVLKMMVSSPNNSKSELLVKFRSNTTDAFDATFDAPKAESMVATSTQLYTMVGQKKLAINSMGELTTASIPMGFEPKVNGTFTLKASELSSFSNGTIITLQDLKTGTFQNLFQNNTYIFTADVNDNVNRFVLHFNTTLGIDNNSQVLSKIYSYGNEIYVSSANAIRQISIYNTLGQLIHTANNPQGLFKYSLNNNSTGYYIVKVITDKNVNSEKVFVK